MDSVSPEIRSQIMSRIKQRDSGIERALRSALWRSGVRYRKNVRMYGTPDMVLSTSRVLVFVDSCFWHGCRFHCRRPKSNVEFWEAKITRNRRRDVRITRHYRRQGWTVLRFWEHQLSRNLADCVNRVAAAVASSQAARTAQNITPMPPSRPLPTPSGATARTRRSA